MSMTGSESVAREPAHPLISSDRIEGTAVYGTNGKRIGFIQCVMIDKISGKVVYAVMSFGGFLGLGEHHYPVPWSMLTYDTGVGGYRVSITEDELKKAPKYASTADWEWSRENDRRIHDFYRATPFWGD